MRYGRCGKCESSGHWLNSNSHVPSIHQGIHKPAISDSAIFTKGSKAIQGFMSLNFQAIPTETGYAQMDPIKRYAANVGPPSKTIPASIAKRIQGSKRAIQRR